MANTITPAMNLIVPGVGTEASPTWALDLNSSLTLIDQHDHTPGKGTQITAAGLNIDNNLPFNNHFATQLAGATFSPQSATPTLDTVYVNGVDLYFVDGVGNNIRITASGGVVGTPGSISNLTAPASANYNSVSSTFEWKSTAVLAANMDFGSAIMRNLSPNSTFGLTLSPPAGLSSNFTLTLPTIPASTSFQTMDNTGQMLTSQVYPLTASGIETAAVTTAKIQDGSVTRPKIAAITYPTSSGTGAYNDSRNSNTPQDVTGTTITFTSTGKPVLFLLQAQPGNTSAYIATSGGTNAGNVQASLYLVDTTTSAVLYRLLYGVGVIVSIAAQGTGSISSQGTNTGNGTANAGITAGANSGITANSSSLLMQTPGTQTFMLPMAAGTYTLKLQSTATSTSGAASFTLNNMQLSAYEMA